MAYDASFSPEFFALPGEIYDGAEYPHGDRPYSVWGAICALTDEECDRMEVPRDRETLYRMAVETNTVDTIRRGRIQVYLRPDGWAYVTVYPADGRPDM